MDRGADRGAIAWAAIDLLGCLFLVVLVLAQPPVKKTPPHIATDGQYAVTIEWTDGSPNDVDVYVEDPDRNICYFGADHIGLMNLENDDLGTVSDVQRSVKLAQNHERVILRGVVKGEYVVNVHMYQRGGGPNPEKVVVKLWVLRGDDRKLKERTIYLGKTGDEQTAFRFTLNAAGDVTSFSRLSRDLVLISSMPADTGGREAPTAPDSYSYHLGNGTAGP